MTLPRWLPWVGLAAAAWLGWLGVQAHLRSDGATDQRVKAREQVIAVMADSLASAQTRIPQVDTVAGTQAVVYRTATVNYAAIRDSLLKEMADSFNRRPGDEKNRPAILIAACNAVVAAADSALSACARRVAVRDTALQQAGALLAQKDSLLADVRKQRQGVRFLGIPLGCTAGLAATPEGSGLGAACGVKLF